MNSIYLLILLTLFFPLYSNDFKIGGQIVGDRAWFEDENKNSLSKGEIRRARVFIKQKINSNLNYEIEYDVNEDEWKDVYLEYEALPNYFFVVGNIKEPFGLEALTSSKYNTFMEASLQDALINSRRVGILVNHNFKNKNRAYTLALGGFGKSLEEALNDEENGKSIVGRATYALILSNDKLFHIGTSLSYTKYDNLKIKLSTLPEADLYYEKTLKTKIKDVQNSKRIGIEGAIVINSFSLQGEYTKMDIFANKRYSFDSWYINSSWFITGESRVYKKKSATFSRVKPYHPINKKGLGAFELAFRVSHLNLNDKDENGGEEYNYTFGLNWYALSNLRFMANYIIADIKESTTQNNIIQFRTQYDF